MNLFFISSLAVFCLQAMPTPVCKSNEPMYQRRYDYNGDEKVAIIGGGAAGTTAAWFLMDGGFKNVTLFEQHAKLGGMAETRQVDGKPYDMTTMWVPDASIIGPGIHPELKKMVDYTKAHLVKAERFEEIHVTGHHTRIDPFPTAHIGAMFASNISGMVTDLMTGYTVNQQLYQCYLDGKDCKECGICMDYEETCTAWGHRMNLRAYTYTFLTDGLGAGPAIDQWCGWILKYIGFWWMPVEVHRILVLIGLNATNLPTNTPQGVSDMFTTNSNVGVGHWWHFEEGYGTFFNTLGNTLVADNKLDLHLNSKVTNITRHKEQWCVTVDGKTPEYFDIIFMSTSPKDALNFMPLGRAKDILSVATIPDTWPSKDIMIAKLAPGYNQTGFTTTFGAWACKNEMSTTTYCWDKSSPRGDPRYIVRSTHIILLFSSSLLTSVI